MLVEEEVVVVAGYLYLDDVRAACLAALRLPDHDLERDCLSRAYVLADCLYDPSVRDSDVQRPLSLIYNPEPAN